MDTFTSIAAQSSDDFGLVVGVDTLLPPSPLSVPGACSARDHSAALAQLSSTTPVNADRSSENYAGYCVIA